MSESECCRKYLDENSVHGDLGPLRRNFADRTRYCIPIKGSVTSFRNFFDESALFARSDVTGACSGAPSLHRIVMYGSRQASSSRELTREMRQPATDQAERALRISMRLVRKPLQFSTMITIRKSSTRLSVGVLGDAISKEPASTGQVAPLLRCERRAGRMNSSRRAAKGASFICTAL
jgi:hypothetical protein